MELTVEQRLVLFKPLKKIVKVNENISYTPALYLLAYIATSYYK